MRISRRAFIAGAIAAGGAAALGGCGGSESASGSGYTGPPRAGGTLRVGAVGKPTGTIRDPYALIANDSDMLLLSLLYDPLTVPSAQTDATSNVAPRLAASWTSDPEQRVWTFTIADGATFHDGSPVTANDVVWSLRTLRAHPSGDWKVPVPPEAITALDDRRVQLACPAPNSQLPLLLRLMTFTVKADSPVDLTKAVGSGPFLLDSYDDGNARLVRNEHWHGGAPLLDAIEVVRFESAQALGSAVTAGQIDLATNVGAVAARAAEHRDDLTVVRRPRDLTVCLALRTSDGPFTDPRVREAIRLGIDRPAMVTQALSGYGSIANDVLGVGDPNYDRELPQRTRDLDRARTLLREAGFDTGASYRCVTKDEAAGEVDSARLIASQLGDIGMRVEVVPQDVTTFYDSSWTKPDAPMSTVSWATNDSLTFFASKVLVSTTSANETAFHDPEFDAVYQQVLATPNGPQQQAQLNTLQRIQYERGGYVVWGTADGVDIVATRVRDAPTAAGYARMQLERTWLAP